MRLIGFSLACLAVIVSSSAHADDHESGTAYKVYLMGGQSNMDGYGFNTDLPPEITEARADARIFVGEDVEDGKDGGGEGIWAPLTAGFGANFSTDGATNSLSDRFGPEHSFGLSMSTASDGEKIAIIKFSRGGTGLINGVSGFGSWDPDYDEKNHRNLYDQALTTISNALAQRDIDGDGRADWLVPSGIVWMQGEADAFDDWASTKHYDRNLGRLMTLFRAALHRDDLPVVIGRIKDSGDTPETRVMKYSPEVRTAQARYAERDPCAKLVTASDSFGFIDGWHYRSQDYINLGNAFAEAMRELESNC